MTFLKWLINQKVYILVHACLWFLTVIFLGAFNMGWQSVVFLSVFYGFGHLVYLTYLYLRHFLYFKRTAEKSQALTDKYLLNTCIEEPNFLEGQLFYDLIGESHKSMNDKVFKYEKAQRDYKTYIEAWVHEIKTPIASLMLHADDMTEDMKKSLHDIQLYVDQSLYYAKSNHLEKDYFIRNVGLDSMVKEVLKNFSRPLIKKKCKVDMDNLSLKVMTDSKWMTFIITQLVKNAIQYSDDDLSLSFIAVKSEGQVSLEVTDNGQGIHPYDLPHVFEKGFTGRKGRLNSQATGIGLYLCKTLCERMGLKISVTSTYPGETKFKIVFPYNTLYDIEA